MPINTLPNYNQQPSDQKPQDNNTDIQTPLLQQNGSISKPQKTGFDKLKSLEGAYINQGFRSCAAFWVCSDEHHHLLHGAIAGQKGYKLLRIIEKTKACSGDIEIEVNHEDPDCKAPFLKFDFNSGCGFLCLFRPEMEVFFVEGGQNEKLGKVVHPFQFLCSKIMEVYDANDSLRFIIKGGFCCQVCCSEWTVCEPFGAAVGNMKRSRTKKDCGWSVLFPKDSSGEDRALLVAAKMMIDVMYFYRALEDTDNENDSNTGWLLSGL